MDKDNVLKIFNQRNFIPIEDVRPVKYSKEDLTLFVEFDNIDFDRVVVTKSNTKDCKVFYAD